MEYKDRQWMGGDRRKRPEFDYLVELGLDRIRAQRIIDLRSHAYGNLSEQEKDELAQLESVVRGLERVNRTDRKF